MGWFGWWQQLAFGSWQQLMNGDNNYDDNNWHLTRIDTRQVPKHPSLEAAPAYQGLPHREIRHLPTKILHISGWIYRWLDDHIAPIKMWCFRTKKHIWVPGLFLEHLVLQKSPKLMRPDSGWRRKRDKPDEAGFQIQSSCTRSNSKDLTNFTLFDNFDYIASNIMLPLSGLLFTIFASWVMKRKHSMDELSDIPVSYTHLTLPTKA